MYEKIAGNFLRHFGVGNNYRGYYFCSYSIKLAVEHPEWIHRITKCIYPEVAKKYKTSCECVERDIRTVVQIVWRNGGDKFFNDLTGTCLNKRPTNSQFIEALRHYIMSSIDDERTKLCIECKAVSDYKEKINELENENQILQETVVWMHEMIWELIKKGI